jgi:hypothetical protein
MYIGRMINLCRPTRALVFIISLLVASSTCLMGASISIPNYSFETPIAPAPFYANPQIDSWQQVPDWTAQESGVFSNVPPNAIDNCDGAQGGFLFATPGVSFFQDYDSTDYAHPIPTHAFDTTYEVGKSYTLTVAVLGGTNLTFPMQEGTTVELDLYYRDMASNIAVVASTTITNSSALFPTNNHFLDFQLQSPTVNAGDAWANQHIGIRLLSTTSTNLMGGYWDLDNIRLTSAVTPALRVGGWANGQFTLTLQSEPGLAFDILAATDPTLAGSNWTRLGTITNLTGTIPFTDTGAGSSSRYYRARQVP